MKNYLKNLQVRRIVAIILIMIMTFISVDLSQVIPVKAATDNVTLYFIDNTAEQWVKIIMQK